MLIQRINSCNTNTRLPSGETLSEAIVKRDMLLKKRAILVSITDKALEKDYRLTHAEVKMNVAVSVEDMQKQIDLLSKEFRLLDTQIQSLNWITELA